MHTLVVSMSADPNRFADVSKHLRDGIPAWAKQQPGETDWNGDAYLPRISGVDWSSRLKVVDPCVDQGTC